MQVKNLTSTKFWLAALVIVSVTVLFILGKVDAIQYEVMVSIAIAVYSGANVIEKFAMGE